MEESLQIEWNIIEYVLPKIEKISKKYMVKFWTQIVTNGFLLDLKKCIFLKKFNLKRIQITLDGSKNVHNSRRRHKDLPDSFSVIVSNINSILKENILKNISLRLNIDNSNYLDIKKFITQLKQFFPIKRINLSLGFVTDTIKNNINYYDDNGIKNTEFVEKYIDLYKVAKREGFKMNDSYATSSFCTAKMKHSFIFAPSGYFYKCLSFVGRKNFSIGKLGENFNFCSDFTLTPYKECLDKKCPYLPLCQCGCRFDNYLHNSDTHITFCDFDLINKINQELTKLLL